MTVPGTSNERRVIAYFSLEFALTESLPNYSGGLGVLAGDHLKSASDLGLPLVGVGLIYHEGYFQQALAPDGWQQEEYHPIDPAAQPIRRLKDENGELIKISVPYAGRDVFATIWRLDVGQTPLLLLDTDIDANAPADRAISGRLYGGDFDTRIQQEILLGIGGVRALHALDLHPAVCHMNEGHSALFGVERIRMLMQESGASFEEARLPRDGGDGLHDPYRRRSRHRSLLAGTRAQAPRALLRIDGAGRPRRSSASAASTRDDPNEPFSMALLGLRLSGYRNGVSKLHGERLAAALGGGVAQPARRPGAN